MEMSVKSESIVDASTLTREALTEEYVRRILNCEQLHVPDHSMKDFYGMGGFFQWVNFSDILPSVPDVAPSSARISVCILTHNNAAYIESIIKAIRPLAYEVIAVDSGSTDGTAQILQGAADRIVTAENAWGFDRKRNTAIQAAQGDWILMLDSDEAISDVGFSALRRYITWADSNNVDVLWLPRYWIQKSCALPLRHYVGELCLWPDPQARLFRAGAQCRYDGVIHEKLHSRQDGKACMIGNPRCALYHFKYWLYTEETLAQTVNARAALQSDNLDGVQLLPWHYGKQTKQIPDELPGDNIRCLLDRLTGTKVF